MKQGDVLKSGKYIYKVVLRNGKLQIKPKFFAWVDLDKFIEIMHGKVIMPEQYE